MNVFSTAFGRYTLQRMPVINNDSLRAWNAADELILNTVHEQFLSQKPNEEKNKKQIEEKNILIINDEFGALSICLNDYSPQSWSDSYQSHLATQHNLQLNNLIDQVDYIPSTELPKGMFDLVLIKVPKTLALLEDQLIKLKAHITIDTQIIAAGMVKHIHSSTLAVFEKILGTTTTSLATKKARLIFPTFEKLEKQKPSFPISFYDKSWDITLSNHANVFAKEKLDQGARFMLEQLQQLPNCKRIIDLGCGNGVLGIIAKRLQPACNIVFIDESYMAVESARENYQTAFGNEEAIFLASDGLASLPKSSDSPKTMTDGIDLILCNPPFHQQHAMGDHLAWEMFKQSLQHLKTGDELWVVGNRHLNYHMKLKRLFGNYKNIAGNKKFSVIEAKKR